MTDTSTEPLLGAESNPKAAALDVHEVRKGGGEARGEETGWLLAELKMQSWLAGPLICVNVLTFLVHLISIMFVGHLGELELASASIASALTGVTGFILLFGMGSALETVCGQECGAKQYHLMGIQMQRAVVVLGITCVPITFIWAGVAPFLLAIGQDPQIAKYAGQYVLWSLPSLYAFAILQPVVKFLQTQSLVLPMALFSVFVLCIHVPVCWLLIFKLGVGFNGAAIATGISTWVDVILLMSYVKFSPNCQKSWTGLSTKAFHDTNIFIKLAVPSAVMMCLHFWSLEVVVLMSGWLPNPQLEMAVFSISLNIIAVMNMVPTGLAGSTSTRVSNELGAGRASAAAKAAMVGFSLGLGEGLVMSSIAFAARSVWVYAFTSVPEVIDHIVEAMPFVAIFAILDNTQTVLSGVMRGCGNQTLAAITNLGAFYVVGLPLATLMAFYYNWNAKGLWVGLLVALAIQTLALGAIAAFSNWKRKARDALDRVYNDELPTVDSTVHKEDLASKLIT